MEYESPVMKAWREFAFADPEDCDREWDAYLALVNRKESASGTSPTSSSTPLHHRAPAAAVTAPSSKRSTAPLHAPSRSISKLAAATPTSTSAPTISTTAPTATASAPTSTRILGSATTAASASRNITKDDLSPGARHIYDLLVGGSVAPDSSTSRRASSSAVPTGAAASSAPASDVLGVHSTSGTIYTRAATATCVRTEMPLDSTPTIVRVATATHEPADLHPVTPSTCSMMGLDDSNGGEDHVGTSLTPWSAPPSSNAPPGDLPRPLSAPLGVLELLMLSPSTCSTECPGSHIGALPAACPTNHTIPSYLLPVTSSAAVTAVQRHDMMSTTGERLEIGEVSMSMEGMFQFAPAPAEVPSTSAIVEAVKGTGTISDVLAMVSIAPCLMGCSNGAVTLMESENTDGDAIQAVIFNSDYVDLAIVNVLPVFMKIPWRPDTFLDMTLVVASTVAGLQDASHITEVTSQNGRGDYPEPVLRLIINLFSWSPQSKWPPMSLIGPSLISADIQQEFMGIHSVTATVSRVLTQVVRWNEAVHWQKFAVFYSCWQPLPKSFPWYIAWLLSCCADSEIGVSEKLANRWIIFSSGKELDSLHLQQAENACCTLSSVRPPATSDTGVLLLTLGWPDVLPWILLLPWDPRLPLSRMNTMFSILVDGRAVRLRSSSAVTCLQGISVHELWQPWISWERLILVTKVYRNPPPAKPPDKSNYSHADKRVRIQWSIRIVSCLCNCSWLVRSGNLFEFKLNEKHKQCSNFIVLMSEGTIYYDSACVAWEIAWLLMGTSHYSSGFGGREHVTGMSIPLDVIFQDWLSCSMGHIIQCGFDIVQWKIAWSLIWGCFEINSTNSKELLLLHRARTYILVGVEHNTKDMNSWDYSVSSTDPRQLNLDCYFPKVFLLGDRGISVGIKAPQLSWDPGDCFASAWRQNNSGRLDDGCSLSRLDTSQAPWDPGGLSEDRLGGKPILRGEDCQRPTYNSYPMGRHLGPWPAWEPDAEGYGGIYTCRAATTKLGLERNGWPRPEGEDRLVTSVCSVLCVHPLPLEFPNFLEFFLRSPL